MDIALFFDAFLKDNKVGAFFEYNKKENAIVANESLYLNSSSVKEIYKTLRTISEMLSKLNIDHALEINESYIHDFKKWCLSNKIVINDSELKEKVEKFVKEKMKKARNVWVVSCLKYEASTSLYDYTLTEIDIQIEKYHFGNENDAIMFAKIYDTKTLSIYKTKFFDFKI